MIISNKILYNSSITPRLYYDYKSLYKNNKDAFKALNGSVKSGYKGLAFLLAAEGNAVIIYGNFDDLIALSHPAGNECLGVVAKEFIELCKLLFDHRLEALTNSHLLCVHRNFHSFHRPGLGTPFQDCKILPLAIILYHIL